MDTVDPMRFVFAFVFVIGLLGVFAVLLRRFGRDGVIKKFSFGKLANLGRIQIIESKYIDPKNKLVLVSRDGVGHLLVIGDGKVVVVESGIDIVAGESNESKA